MKKDFKGNVTLWTRKEGEIDEIDKIRDWSMHNVYIIYVLRTFVKTQVL